MPRVYTRIFSNEAYQLRLPSSKPAVAIGAGMMRLVALKVGSEGRLTDLTVKQDEADGTQVAFSVEVLKSRVPFPLVDTDFAVGTPPVDTISLYRVIPPQTAPATFPVEFNEQTVGYAYKNMDGSYTNNQQFLYLLLTPTGAGVTTNWKISVSVERSIAEI